MGEMLTVDAILATSDIQENIVEIPEWGGSVRVRSMTKAEQREMRRQSTINGEIDPDRVEPIMIALSVIEPKFTVEQAEKLQEKSASAVDRIMREITSLNGFSVEVAKQLRASFRSGDAESE